MQSEYVSLTIMTFFFVLAWVPASVGKARSFGIKWVGSNRNPVTDKELLPWAARCERAHNNLKEFYPAFVVAIILLGVTQKFTQGTAIASIIYVISRFGHFASYAIGNVSFRALFFFTGLLSNIYLLAMIVI